jgi:hypothetical protein
MTRPAAGRYRKASASLGMATSSTQREFQGTTPFPFRRRDSTTAPCHGRLGVYWGIYYAFYIDAGGKRQRKSLNERNELRAQSKFTKLLEDLDRGLLGFSRTPFR